MALVEVVPLLRDAAAASEPMTRLKELILVNPTMDMGAVVRVARTEWARHTATMSARELESLIRLLTLAEAELGGWGGGSVSSIIWLFRIYSGLDGSDADGLAEWILQQGTDNPYLPYGTQNHGARSLKELAHLREGEMILRRLAREAETLRKEEAQERRAKKATSNLPAAIRRGDVAALGALVAQGAELSATASLNVLALTQKKKGQPEEAQQLYEHSLMVAERSLGPSHPRLAAGLYDLALFYLDLAEWARAKIFLERGLGILEETYGPDHPDAAGFLEGLALLRRKTGGDEGPS